MMARTVTKKTVRQQEIVDAARKIISSKGTKSLTTREIAKALRITDGALYRHFKSKKEIISLLIDDIEESLLSAIETAVNKSSGPLEKLWNIFFSRLSTVEQRKGVNLIIINETLSLKDKALQRKMYAVVQKYLKIIQKILSDGVKLGRFKKDLDVVFASIAFYGMAQSAVTIWALSDFGLSLKQDHLKKMFDIFKNGIMA